MRLIWTYPIATYGAILPMTSSTDWTGETMSCSSVPRSRLRPIASDVVGAGDLEPAHEVARLRRAVRVVDDGRHVTDVGVDRVAKQDELHDGQQDHHGNRQPIAAQLDELLARDDEGAGDVHDAA